VGWSGDTEGFCFRLRFDPEHCKWAFIGNDGQAIEEKAEEKTNKEIGGEEYVLSAVMHADERNRAESERLGRDVFHLIDGNLGTVKK
jgi:hypothetical protein